mgnify:FL=1
MQRRHVLAGLSLPWWAFNALASDAAQALRQGGCAVLIRHAQTTPGVGDPKGFRLDMCVSQRNLNDEGRAQARRMGKWFQAQGLKPRVVKSSNWCRCKETANLAFGKHLVWPALNSIFEDRASEPQQTADLRAALRRIEAGSFEAWVTHQVNITALTGEASAMGEGLVVDASGSIIVRTTFS